MREVSWTGHMYRKHKSCLILPAASTTQTANANGGKGGNGVNVPKCDKKCSKKYPKKIVLVGERHTTYSVWQQMRAHLLALPQPYIYPGGSCFLYRAGSVAPVRPLMPACSPQ